MSELNLKNTLLERKELGEIFEPLFKAMNADSYGTHYENNTFKMRPYCWCGEDTCGMCGDPQSETTFFYKKTGWRLQWYKYAMRSVQVSEHITADAIREIIKDCIDSLSLEHYTIEERCKIGVKRGVGVLGLPKRDALLVLYADGANYDEAMKNDVVMGLTYQEVEKRWTDLVTQVLADFEIPKTRIGMAPLE